MNLNEFLKSKETATPSGTKLNKTPEAIPQGRRNSTLASEAARILKRYGDTPESRKLYADAAKRCEPPLGDDEVAGIWKSAMKLYDRIKDRPDYIPPDLFTGKARYMPNDFTHLGQAERLAAFAENSLRYTSATGYLFFNGNCWEESETKARTVVHELTDQQLSESKYFDDSDGSYRKFVKSARNSNFITATLKEAASKLEIPPEELDKNPFLLCTPEGSYDLTRGMNGRRDSNPRDYITKCTSVSPGDSGEEIWREVLECIFCGDEKLIKYVQELCGLAAIGKVMDETLIISYGSGGNGKSTFWNTILKVMGKYGDTISSDVLTMNCKRNVAPEIADIRGKRLLLSSETQEGARLDEAMIKKLCSTDNIRGERKYHDPLTFTPTHTLMLFTNHLPKVSSTDDGIWRRLKVIPFNAKFTGENDIKGFSDLLYENAGPAVLKWIIQGAETVIWDEYRIEEPECVKEAIAQYRESSNWFHQFVTECCDVGESYQESSKNLYDSYTRWCETNGEYKHGSRDFYRELDREEYKRATQKNQRIIKGIKLKDTFYLNT